MPVTLAQARINTTDDLQRGVADEFAKSSFILNNIPFHDCVSPVGGGATLTYGYTRLITQPVAEFRKINSEFSKHEVEKQRYVTELKVFGGAFSVDRIIARMGGLADEVSLQLTQKVKATKALFHDTIINGNSAVDEDVFDGLDVAVTGSDTEYNKAGEIDLSTSALIDQNYMAFTDMLDEFVTLLDGTPSALMMNTTMATKMRAVARRVGMYQKTSNQWGEEVEYYGNIPFVDLGAKAGSNEPVVATDENGKTSIYAVRFGLDGFHAISMAGKPLVEAWLPKYDEAGAVKDGEVEMVAGCALKSTKAAGAFRNIKVQ